jgi:signal transduction histidine kinase
MLREWRLGDLGGERLVALARTALAAFALLAIYLDPTQPSLHAAVAYAILIGYLALALVLAAAAFTRPLPPVLPMLVHIVEIGAFGVLMYLTDGPSSPFFVFFTFALLSATLHWNGWGAIATAALLILVFSVLSLASIHTLSAQDDDFNRLIMRSIYLLVASGLLASVGAHRRRTGERLTRLASWPTEETLLAGSPSLGRSLAHAVEVMRGTGALVVWEDAQEPYVYTAACFGGGGESGELAADAFGEAVAPALETECFLARDPSARSVLLADRSIACSAPAVNPALRQLAGRPLISAPFASSKFTGRVFIVEPRPLDRDLLPLAQIVARRLGIELEHYFLRLELQQQAAARERIRLARDVHDGTLQALTAAALQLKAIKHRADRDTREDLDRISALLSSQQRRLRRFMSQALDPAGRKWEPAELETCCRKALAEVERQWGCRTKLDVIPADAVVTTGLSDHLFLLLVEAAANAVRHGKAKCIEIAAQLAAGSLSMRIKDDGEGFPNLRGVFEHHELLAKNIGPASLRGRIEALGGTLTLASGAGGAELLIELGIS